MSDLYVYQGAQYPADKLPKGVKAKDCLTLDEYFKRNRRTGSGSSLRRKPEVDPTIKPVTDSTTKPAGDGPVDKPVTEMSKEELVAFVKANKLDVDTGQNKPELLAAVQAAVAS